MQFDCLILGAGVVGLSLARELAGAGATVGVVDRHRPGSASWAGAGILPPPALHGKHDPVRRLATLSYAMHEIWSRELLEETGIDNGYHKCGGFYVARHKADAITLEAAATDWEKEGVNVLRYSRNQLAEVEPKLSDVAHTQCALFLANEAQLRNPWHLKALRLSCEQRDVRIVADTGASEIEKLPTDIGFAVATRVGELHCRNLCVTAGAWSAQVLRKFGLDIPITPIRGQMVLWRPAHPVLQHIVNEGPRYLVPRQDGRVLAGSTMEDVDFDYQTTEQGIRSLVQFSTRLVPTLKESDIERTWAGLRPTTGDGLPYLGPVPGFEGLFVAAGHGRNGIYLSTGTAAVMAGVILGEEPPFSLFDFRADRH